MFKNKKTIVASFFISLILLVSFVFNVKDKRSKSELPLIEKQEENKISFDEGAKNELQSIKTIDELDEKIEDKIEVKSVKYSVPFVVQAPFANWKDNIFQNACEEASIVMAMGWVKDIEKISPQQAFEQINEIVVYENKTFGFNEDIDLKDAEKIFKQYFSYEKVNVREDIKVEDIINELMKGNIVLVPVFGQVLENPNFTSPGPVAHMLVIVGYDKENKEFITNDPGTKKGESFRYKENVLYDAIWTYPQGEGPLKIPKKEEMKKSILAIGK